MAPFGLEWLIYYLRVGKLEVAHFLGDDGAFMLRFEFRYQPCLEFASFLWVQIAYFLRNIKEGCNCLIMALLRALISSAASTTYVNGLLLTFCVSNKLARLLLNIPGSAR